MSWIGRRPTREIVIALEATSASRYEAAELHRAQIAEALSKHAAETAAMHAEGKAALADVRTSVSRVHERIDGFTSKITWKIIAWLTALNGAAFSIIVYLITKGVPWR